MFDENPKNTPVSLNKWSMSDNALMGLCRSAGIPMRFIGAKHDKYHDDSVFMYGPRGVGKTHYLCACIKQEIFRREYRFYVAQTIDPCDFPPQEKIRFLPVPELMLLFKQSYSPGAVETESDVLGRLASCDVLGLDDMGAERVSDWSIQMLYLLIDRRYREMKKTYITSNLSLREIAEKLDDRISSRLAEMCEVMKFQGEDRRIKKQERSA